jgi:cold shock CspA family protein
MMGKVTNLDSNGAYGFCANPEGSYFFHRSSFRPGFSIADLGIGDVIEFEPDLTAPRGPRCLDVRPPGVV